ncbi:MAG: hypothetical protein WCD35_11310 [Mycobacteriales bacterium]
MTSRQKAYFAFRGAAAGIFLLSATVLPRGAPAVIGALVAGMGGILSCIGVNAGGPGEQAGARVEQAVLDRSRAPQGDWPPYDEGKVIEGELVTPPAPPSR